MAFNLMDKLWFLEAGMNDGWLFDCRSFLSGVARSLDFDHQGDMSDFQDHVERSALEIVNRVYRRTEPALLEPQFDRIDRRDINSEASLQPFPPGAIAFLLSSCAVVRPPNVFTESRTTPASQSADNQGTSISSGRSAACQSNWVTKRGDIPIFRPSGLWTAA